MKIKLDETKLTDYLDEKVGIFFDNGDGAEFNVCPYVHSLVSKYIENSYSKFEIEVSCFCSVSVGNDENFKKESDSPIIVKDTIDFRSDSLNIDLQIFVLNICNEIIKVAFSDMSYLKTEVEDTMNEVENIVGSMYEYLEELGELGN